MGLHARMNRNQAIELPCPKRLYIQIRQRPFMSHALAGGLSVKLTLNCSIGAAPGSMTRGAKDQRFSGLWRTDKAVVPD